MVALIVVIAPVSRNIVIQVNILLLLPWWRVDDGSRNVLAIQCRKGLLLLSMLLLLLLWAVVGLRIRPSASGTVVIAGGHFEF